GNAIGFDPSSLMSSLSVSSEESELISAQIELLKLKAQQEVLKLQSNSSLSDVYKAVAESAKKAYDETNDAVNELKKGWIAENDGIVREVNISAGKEYKSGEEKASASPSLDISSIISQITSGTANLNGILQGLFSKQESGMIIEYYPFDISFTLGKYDISKVSMKQKATVTSASGESFDGYVSYISPVASTGSAININTIISSGTGASSAGVEAKITVPKPDKSLIIGMDADISIDLSDVKDALLIPIESVLYEDEQAYVYTYNAKEKRAEKTDITTGLFDGTSYQVTSGLKEGDVIIKSPSLTLSDGDKVTIKKDKKA
nr:hypothetical protein [Clostridiales bacterium]